MGVSAGGRRARACLLSVSLQEAGGCLRGVCRCARTGVPVGNACACLSVEGVGARGCLCAGGGRGGPRVSVSTVGARAGLRVSAVGVCRCLSARVHAGVSACASIPAPPRHGAARPRPAAPSGSGPRLGSYLRRLPPRPGPTLSGPALPTAPAPSGRHFVSGLGSDVTGGRG